MEVVKFIQDGRRQGVYAITKEEEVTDFILDAMNNGEEDGEYTEEVLRWHLKEGCCIIPKGAEPFDWDESIHGDF